ncbi:MAG: hypothetical protein ABR499_10955 [Gemmatimonadaceae bacterium]
MATVLIIATDPVIGGLVGHLADLAGHAVQFRRDGEEPTEAVRHSHPDVVMLDAAYVAAAMDPIAESAADVGAAVVYFASTLPPSELRRLAVERGATYFALPAGPKLLGLVIAGAVAAGRAHTPPDNLTWSSQYAVAAAVAAVSRARGLVDHSAAIRTESRLLRAEHEAALADCRRSQAELREAVVAYTRELRGSGVPPERTLEMVRDALRFEAGGARAPAEIDRDLDDAVEWCLQAYYAA